MHLEGVHKPWNVLCKKAVHRGIAPEFTDADGEGSGDVDQGAPLLSAFPPTVVGRVGPEHQKKRQDEAQQRVHHVAQLDGRIQDFHFHVTHPCRPQAHAHQSRNETSEDLPAVSVENEAEPGLGVVLNHVAGMKPQK